MEFWPALGLNPGSEVFVPLCGKTLDMRWLEAAGHKVLGVELAQIAIENYFADAQEQTQIDIVDRFTCYRGQDTVIFQGDFFDLTSPLLKKWVVYLIGVLWWRCRRICVFAMLIIYCALCPMILQFCYLPLNTIKI